MSWLRVLTGGGASWGGVLGDWRSGSNVVSRSWNLDSLLVILVDNFMVIFCGIAMVYG